MVHVGAGVVFVGGIAHADGLARAVGVGPRERERRRERVDAELAIACGFALPSAVSDCARVAYGAGAVCHRVGVNRRVGLGRAVIYARSLVDGRPPRARARSRGLGRASANILT